MVNFARDSDFSQNETIVEPSLLAENLNEVFDNAILHDLRLKCHLSELFFLLLLLLLLLIRILSCVLEALLVPSNFVITDLHDQFDIVFHDHVKEITHGILFGRTCSDDELFPKTRVNPGSIDIIIEAVLCFLRSLRCLHWYRLPARQALKDMELKVITPLANRNSGPLYTIEACRWHSSLVFSQKLPVLLGQLHTVEAER